VLKFVKIKIIDKKFFYFAEKSYIYSYKLKINVMSNYPKPYTYEYVHGWLWYNGFYYILFDGEKLTTVKTKDEAENMIRLLNGAYMLGYVYGKEEVKQENKKSK